MPSPYTGQPFPPVAQDLPSPIAGNAPVPVLPLDGENRNAASVAGPYKTLADFIAYQQAIVNGVPAVTPQATVPGFSAVSHAGPGTGTVSLVAVSSTVSQVANGSPAIVIKIVVGGATGTATAQASSDGGNTYGGTFTTTAGNYGLSGIGAVVTFSGTFTAGDTYSFSCAFAPQLATKDSSGLIRHVVDHNGYPMGRRVEFREDWFSVGAGSASPAGSPPYMLLAGPSFGLVLGAGASGGSKWQVNGTASVGSIATGADSALGANCVTITSGTSNTNKTYLQATAPLLIPTTKTVLSLEWCAQLSSTGANNVTASMGLFDTYATPLTSGNALFLTKTSAQTTWRFEAIGSGSSTVDTGATPAAATWQRFRIELHGSASPLGTALGSVVMLCFVNELLCAVRTTNAPAAAVALMFGLEVTAGTSAVGLTVGPVLASYAHVYGDISGLPAL